MQDSLSITQEKVQRVVQQKGNITLSELEAEVDASYNLIFLALDRMVAESKLRIERWGRDYMISGKAEHLSSMELLRNGELPGEMSLRCESQYIAQDME
ncbi:MAG: hypothetical protein HZA19_00305 [Nitrospirae bacterium]|nr:hypothetical protein [Nitrospirota bacterium]